MADISELVQMIKAAAKKATQGEWWSDEVETDGAHGSGDDVIHGFRSYAVYDHNDHLLLDMTNSTAAIITVEDDGEHIAAWDEVARRNAEFITLSCPENILALTAALEKVQTRIADLEARTVKLPATVAATQYLFPVAVYEADSLRSALTEAGIKWETE